MKKVALVTGASSGIGLELARIHASRGGSLILVARRKEKLLELKRELEEKYSANVIVIAKDLTQKNAAQEIYNELKDKKIFVEYLINNAGFGVYGPFAQADWNKLHDMMELNMMALTHLSHLFVQDMIEHKTGKILNVASTAAFQPGPLLAIYYATKHFVLAFSEALANELKGSGVSVTTLCPGPTQSEFMDVAKMQKIKLVENRKMPSSYDAALYGYNKMLKKKVVVIHGLINRIVANTVRFFPRKFVTNLVRKIQTPS